MLYLKKEVTEKQLLEYGFKRCRKPYDIFWYICIARGIKVIYTSPGNQIIVQDWEDNDPRIHNRPNCKYRSLRTAEDILYDLIVDGYVESKLV